MVSSLALWLSAAPAPAPGAADLWAAALRFAPQVVLHSDETYLPTSMEDLLDGASFVDPTGRAVPTAAGALRASQGTLRLAERWARGTPWPALGRRIEAPMYLAVQPAADGSWVDLHYILLFGHQGPQVVRFADRETPFFAAVAHYGEHRGDLERLSLRLDSRHRQVLQVQFEAHGQIRTYPPEQVHFVAGTHPLVHCALHSHALLNPSRRQGQSSLSRHRVGHGSWRIDLVDLTDAQGPVWQPERAAQLRPLCRCASSGPCVAPAWASYGGSLGEPQVNLYSGLIELPSAPLQPRQRAWAKTLVAGARLWVGARTLGQSTPPGGPATRPWLASCAALPARLSDADVPTGGPGPHGFGSAPESAPRCSQRHPGAAPPGWGQPAEP